MANVFLDWNPIYGEEYETRLGYGNKAYEPVDDEQSLFAKMISEAKKL